VSDNVPAPPDAELYVYGVIRTTDAQPVRAPGVGIGSPVRVVQSTTLCAVTSDVERGYVHASREDLQRHMRVLQDVAAFATVVPLKFGTVMPDEEAVIRELLQARRSDLERLLAALDGRVELSLRATYEEIVLSEVVEQDAEVASLRERVRGRDEASTYYERIRLGELVAAAMVAKRRQDTADVLAKLQPLAEDVRLGDVSHERSVLSAAFLVRRERLEEFDSAAAQVAAEQEARIKFRYAGPLPPYSFVGSEDEGPWGS